LSSLYVGTADGLLLDGVRADNAAVAQDERLDGAQGFPVSDVGACYHACRAGFRGAAWSSFTPLQGGSTERPA